MSLEARVIVSLSHGEDTPPIEFINNSRETIDFLFSEEKLTQESLEKGSCILIYNPRTSFSKEEIALLKKYRSKGGIVLIVDYKDPEEYEIFKRSNFVEQLFDTELIFRQFIPSVDFGTYQLVYKKDSFFSSEYKRVMKKLELPCSNFSRKIRSLPSSNLPFSLLKEINEDDRKFISFFRHKGERVFLQRLTEWKNSEGMERFLVEDKLKEKYKWEGEYYLVGGIDMNEILYQLYSSVGILSSVGYGVALSTDKPFEEISKNSELSVECQNLLENILVWASQGLINRFSGLKKEARKEKKVAIEVRSEETFTPAQEKEAIYQVELIISDILFKAANLGRLLERGTVEETLNVMNDLAHTLRQQGNEESSSLIFYFYRRFDQFFSSPDYQIPGNMLMEEALKILPQLKRDKEDLHKTIERIISQYEKMK